ncbi:tRNA-ribosyltransferase [Methanosarcina sp. KYL-1]|uniref:archaeosine synthase subunit alpha n=1 Tax=Methanosarcina sp. KYL-1 TaxID=2602068 RepID=UPI002100D27B|nr:archaeosine synthase subunit alpha [Methanosarcina sp. KYL-1]MCQ1536758.1 tRNA-ribosyltransferase [Methanosarcina sp. KYL-1]
MTRYFEVEQRDGAARVGKLLLSSEIRTPCVLHTADLGNLETPGPIVDAGSFWSEKSPEEQEAHIKQIREKAGEGAIIILPHQAYPPAVPADSRGKAETSARESAEKAAVEGPTGSLLRAWEEPKKSDLYVMEGAGTLENNARRFLETLLDLKSRIPPDTALYAPSLALPENAAMLAYLGIDVLDDTRTETAAYSDHYLTAAGRFYLDALTEFPCRCRVCASTTPEEFRALPKVDRAKLLAAHNRDALEAELALVREKIRAGTLREYVEGQCRVRPWLTALLRLGDFEYAYLEEKVPAFRQNQLLADTSESLTRIEVARFARRVQERYTPPDLDILLLLPCAAKKPYSISQSHQKFMLALGKYRKFVHEVIITSPLGIVPRELELTYPAAHYDTAVTGHWDEEEKAWVSGCLEAYLEKYRYKAVLAHVDGAYREICEMVGKKLGIEIIYTAEESLTSFEALSSLKNAVEALCTSENFSRKSQNSEEEKKNFVRAIAGYQFGEAAGLLFPEEAGSLAVKGRFPKYQLFSGKKQLATLVPQYGMLALSPEGAELMVKSGNYVVQIDDFIPKGSILAPGVVAADPGIRPNDEVIILGKRALCVGRALMSGQEMEKASRGIAVAVRHVKKL